MPGQANFIEREKRREAGGDSDDEGDPLNPEGLKQKLKSVVRTQRASQVPWRELISYRQHTHTHNMK